MHKLKLKQVRSLACAEFAIVISEDIREKTGDKIVYFRTTSVCDATGNISLEPCFLMCCMVRLKSY